MLYSLQTSHDYLHTLEYLALMGYSSLANGSLITAIEGKWSLVNCLIVYVHLWHCIEIQFHDKRKSVYRCKVFGSRRSGKTTIVRGLVGKHEVRTILLFMYNLMSITLGTDNTGR